MELQNKFEMTNYPNTKGNNLRGQVQHYYIPRKEKLVDVKIISKIKDQMR